MLLIALKKTSEGVFWIQMMLFNISGPLFNIHQKQVPFSGWGKRTPDKRTLPQRTQAKGPWTKGPSKLKDPGSKGPWTKRTLVKGPWGKRTLGKRTLKKRTLGKRTLKKGPSKYFFFNFYFFMA